MKQSIVYLFITAFILTLSVEAKETKKKFGATNAPAGVPNATLMNINNISAWYSSNGRGEHNPFTGNSGLFYPRGTAAAVYTSGLMIGAYSNDGVMASNQPRVTGNNYNAGFAPGAILGLRTGIVENAADPNVRIWRIRRDYATADLTKDAAEYYQKAIASVTANDIQLIRDQYKKDWQEWPASKGAPFYDSNNDGIYSPQFEIVGGKEAPKIFPAADEPGIAKGDQVIWFVCNDIAVGDSPWKTKPMGLEEQVTLWGYNSSGITGNIIYKKYKVIYKGTSQTPAGSVLTDVYFTHWSDPDIGNAGDDYVGCDTTLGLAFTFNAFSVDQEYAKFGLVPPALGFDFLQGPIVPSPGDTAIFDLKKRPGYKNLPMSSFIYFAAGDEYSDPPFTLNGSWQWYSMMLGGPPTPQPPPFPGLLTNPVTKQPTKYWMSGDPVSRTGWIDEGYNGPGDRRTLQNSGPFTMAIGDTQEIVVGVIAAIGTDNLNSVTRLKESDRYVQFMYNTLFQVIPPSLQASVSYPNQNDAAIGLKSVTQAGSYSAMSATVKGTTVQLFDDGQHADGNANDGTFANSLTLARSLQPTAIDLSFTTSSNATYAINNVFDRITTAGSLSITNAPIIFDNINNNGVVNNGEYVHFLLTLKNNSPFTLSGVRGVISTGLGVSESYPFGTFPSAGEITMSERAYRTFRLPMNYSSPSFTVSASLSDTIGNYWSEQWTFPVVQFASLTDSLENTAVNIIGNNDGRVGFVLYNPASAGEQYDIWYGRTVSALTWTVVKEMSGADYATVNASLNAKNLVPPIHTLPNASGSGTFTLNDAKSLVKYSITVSGLTGAVTAAYIQRGASGINGNPVHTLAFTGNSASGSWALPESLVTDFTSGTLYVSVQTAANPGGEIRGQIANGLNERQTLPNVVTPLPGLFTYSEQRLAGFSLYVAPAPLGIRAIRQTAPTEGDVQFKVNPENSYRIVTFTPETNFAGSKAGNTNLEIRFVDGVNYAMLIPNITSPTPGVVYFVKVPFAVYLDTTRVWPVIYNTNAADSAWSIQGNQLYNGKATFDRILGIADVKDAANIDITYYSPTNTIFPPTSNAVKGRILNAVNHVYKDIVFVNEKGDGISPATGTKILFTQYKAVQSGDIKRIALKPLEVATIQNGVIPSDYVLSQNYPNPFNPTTTIQFGLPRRSVVALEVYDLLGRRVRTLINGEIAEGTHTVQWDGRNAYDQLSASGIYFYRLSGDGFIRSRKMILLK